MNRFSKGFVFCVALELVGALYAYSRMWRAYHRALRSGPFDPYLTSGNFRQQL